MDYWDHPEYGNLEKKFEKQVASTRKWMALHDEAVEREAILSAENSNLKLRLEIAEQQMKLRQLECASTRHADE